MGIRYIDPDDEEMNDFIEPPVWDGTIPDDEECQLACNLIPDIGAPNESIRQPNCSDKLVVGLGTHDYNDAMDRFFRGIYYFCQACKDVIDEYDDLVEQIRPSASGYRYFPKMGSSERDSDD